MKLATSILKKSITVKITMWLKNLILVLLHCIFEVISPHFKKEENQEYARYNNVIPLVSYKDKTVE